MMRPVSNWRWVAKKAWSIRLGVISGVFSAVEVALPFFESAIPRGVFAAVSGLVAMGAVISRFVAQDHD